MLTDSGQAFTDRFCATGERTPTGQHPFDRTCTAHDIQHRLIKPRPSQTNGMVERCHVDLRGVISEVRNSTRFVSGEQLATTLQRYATVFNHLIPQRNSGHRTPVETLRHWCAKQPELFVSDPDDLPGPDGYVRYPGSASW